MATFSLGTSGNTPGAPGVYINEQPGKVAFGGIADFSTVYMLVETEEGVPVTRFPFNQPIAISSLNDYKELIRIGNSTVPESRIPLLSYNCVNEFFQNAVTGDLRVVRVGTPNEITEISFNPAATKLNSTDLPSALQAGNKVYVQMILNGLKLVAGDGSTGYTSDGEWLGVPVEIPVTYVAGDEANNRKISAAIAAAVAEAIETNPAVRSSVYVRKVGMVNDVDPASNSELSYITIAATTFNADVSVITEVLPVGTNFVFMQNAYDVANIVGGSVAIERVPQDYTQCIDTAFDGVQDQGYLITPTAYAQFDADGRSLVGAAAAAHCENNNFKWMALADPGPYLVTDINEYQDFVPHKPAADLEEGKKYLVDNAIYKWIGNDVSYPKATYQDIVPGENAATAINESANLVADSVKIGLLDPATYTIAAVGSAAWGVFELNTVAYWPVELPIQRVNLSGISVGNDFTNVYVRGFADDNPTITGPVYQASITVPGSGFPASTTTTGVPIASSSGAGIGGTLTITTNAAGEVSNVVVVNGGNGYAPGDTFVPGGIFGTVTLTVTNVDVAQNLSGTEVFVVAAPRNLITDSAYSLNYVLLATTGSDASSVYNSVVLANGSDYISEPVVGSIYIPGASGDTAVLRYADPYWDLPVEINGQTSDLVENISGETVGLNTQHLPGTLQDPTNTYVLNWVSRTILNPSTLITSYAGTIVPAGTASFNVISHGLRNGQKIYFTQPVTVTSGGLTSNLIRATTKLVTRAYYVKVIDLDSFALSNSLANYTTNNYLQFPTGTVSSLPTIFYSQVLGKGETVVNPVELLTLPMVRARKYAFDSNTIWNQALDATLAPTGNTVYANPETSIYLNNSALILGEDQITPYGEDISSNTQCDYLPKLNTVNPDGTPVPAVLNAYCVPTVDQFFQSEAYFVPAIDPIFAGLYDGTVGSGTIGPAATFGVFPATGAPDGIYNNVVPTTTFGTGAGLVLTVKISGGVITQIDINDPGEGYTNTSVVTLPTTPFGGGNLPITGVLSTYGSISAVVGLDAATLISGFPVAAGPATDGIYTNVAPASTSGTGVGLLLTITVSGGNITNAVISDGGRGYAAADTVTLSAAFGGAVLNVAAVGNYGYAAALGIQIGDSSNQMNFDQAKLTGCYFQVDTAGFAPDGTPVVVGDRIVMTYNGSSYDWVVVPSDLNGGDLTAAGQTCYGSQVELVFTPEQGIPKELWRFDAITSTEIIDDALRGVGFSGEPQAEFIEAGVDNVNRLFDDSQLYGNPFGFIAYYGPYIENGAGQWIPPSPYVTGVAVRRYRSEGYQFPPAGVKYQLRDAQAVQIPVNSSQQNLLNPKGCNVVRTLPGYPDNAVFIWGGRTRLLNPDDAQQKLYQFVNTRVILNVVYGSLRRAFDNQIFNVVDGFNVIYNQIVLIGNSILNQLYVRGALFGAKPSEAFQVICDPRINPPEDLENGIVNAKVFVTPVPTLERIQIDLIRVAIGQMQKELEVQGLSQ